MCDIKVVEKITDEEFEKRKDSWGDDGLNISVQDLGFCIKAELSEEESKELEEIENKIKELCGPMKSMTCYGGKEIINGIEVPVEWTKRRDELNDKVYSEFCYAQPGYVEQTMEIAKKNNRKLHIPKGTKMYYDYPLSCVVVVEIQRDLEESYEFVQAFCDGYQEIYALENDSSKIKEGTISGMLNRNKTNGCFGIWGHCIEDLVLEDISVIPGDGIYHIEFFIGS